MEIEMEALQKVDGHLNIIQLLGSGKDFFVNEDDGIESEVWYIVLELA